MGKLISSDLYLKKKWKNVTLYIYQILKSSISRAVMYVERADVVSCDIGVVAP